MALIRLQTQPTPRQLRQFGCLWLPLFCALVGYLVWRAQGEWVLPGSIWGVGLASAVFGAVWPRLIRPFFLAAIYLTAPIGWVISHAVLVVVYYGVLTPTGLLLRLVGRDPIPRGFDASASTYWRPASRERPLESYTRQF